MVLFLFHPDIAKFMFLNFNCVKIDGLYRVKFSVDSVCYQGQHLFFTLVIVIPSIILWVFGIPLASLFIMNKYSKASKQV